MHKIDAITCLSLQLRVAETIPCLEYEEFHHKLGVRVGASSVGVLVVVYGLYDGCEGFPVDQFFGFSWFVAVFGCFMVYFS